MLLFTKNVLITVALKDRLQNLENEIKMQCHSESFYKSKEALHVSKSFVTQAIPVMETLSDP